MKQSLISAAVISVLGLTAGAADAAGVTHLTIKDVGSNTSNATGSYSSAQDGYSGAFQFISAYIGKGSYAGASTFSGDTGAGAVLGGGAANPTGSFTTGFLFSGAPFVPQVGCR